jgi:hypothetical protein
VQNAPVRWRDVNRPGRRRRRAKRDRGRGFFDARRIAAVKMRRKCITAVDNAMTVA